MLKIETIDPQPEGGQKVYPRAMWIRVTNEDSGFMAACKASRSQYKNREIALSMIEWGKANVD